MKMASNANKDPIANLTDKLRGLFGFGDHPKNNNNQPPKKRFNIWYLLMAVLFFSYAQQFLVASKVETIPYSQFKQSIADGTVDKLTIEPETITGTLKGSTGQAFKTVRVDDPGLAKELDERNISYSGRHEINFWAIFSPGFSLWPFFT
jgi:cell division protease FtsH